RQMKQTGQHQLLIFTHPFAPEAGIQVPGGTLRDDETPADGALREAMEETGLTGLRIVDFLGEVQRDMSDYGIDQLHHRHFFHLICDQDTAEIWRHGEFDPSDSDGQIRPDPIIFEFFWASIPDALPPLIAGHDALLSELLRRLGVGQTDTNPETNRNL
ncbi:MAG TPA: NUDIX domain-containing protein, partial [Phototrophicaceae bacterium]|nr:NUDIX domain-containing protein [Phototrophicaceae bacterium]